MPFCRAAADRAGIQYQGIVPYLFYDDAERPVWIGIWVDDVDAVYRRVQDAGIECEAPVDRDFGVRMLTVPDEMGYLWGFIRRT